jgi:hypothetical protein
MATSAFNNAGRAGSAADTGTEKRIVAIMADILTCTILRIICCPHSSTTLTILPIAQGWDSPSHGGSYF